MNAQSLIITGAEWVGMGMIRSSELRAAQNIIIRFIANTSSQFVASVFDEIKRRALIAEQHLCQMAVDLLIGCNY